jgi:Asp-tRNA(Asn)/Glu-tRNA(Gln) amidotransferase A subunit family amidase
MTRAKERFCLTTHFAKGKFFGVQPWFAPHGARRSNKPRCAPWISFRKYFGKSDVSARTKAIITLGQFQYTANYQKALERQAKWQHALRQVFEKVDCIALPTLQKLPPKIPLFGGGAVFEAQVLGLQNTEAVNFAGNPALAIPIPAQDKTVPVISLQLVGPPMGEAALLNVGRLIEEQRSPLDQKLMTPKSVATQ